MNQDWETVTIRKAFAPKEVRGCGSKGSTGPRVSTAVLQQSRVAETDGPVKFKVLSADSVAAIQAYRRTNKLTQVQLEQRLAMPKGTVGLLESRRAAPTTRDLRSLSSLLKVGLTLE